MGRAPFFEMWCIDFLVIRVCYVSRSNTLKSWISEKVHGWFLSTDTKRTRSKRVEIAGMWWNMTGYRIFHMNILTLSKIWGHHTDAPWNCAYAHMFSFFLASRFEIGKWILIFLCAVCVLYRCIEIGACACFGYVGHAWHPRRTSNRFYRHMKATMGRCGVPYVSGEPKNTHNLQFQYTCITDIQHL